MAFLSFRNALLALALSHHLSSVDAILRYIDDENGDELNGVPPIFFPGSSGQWSKTFSGCSSCNEATDLPFNGTISEIYTNKTIGTPATVQFNFAGTALEIFVFTSDVTTDLSDPEKVTDTHLQLFIDGALTDKFDHIANGTGNPNSYTDGLNYYVSAFKKTDLPLKNHTVEIRNIGISHFWFDYAQYDDGRPNPNPPPVSVSAGAAGGSASRTSGGSASSGTSSVTDKVASGSALPTSTANASSKNITGTIIKAAAAGAAVILLIVIIAVGIYCRRKNRRQRRPTNFNAVPPPNPWHTSEKPDEVQHMPSQSEVGYQPQEPSPTFSNGAGYGHAATGRHQQNLASPPSRYGQSASVSDDHSVVSPNPYAPPVAAPFPGGFVSGPVPTSTSPAPTQYSTSTPPTTSSPAPPASSQVHIPGTGYVLSPPSDANSDAIRAKHVEREQEYARYVYEQEQALLVRAHSQGPPSNPQYQGQLAAPTVPPSGAMQVAYATPHPEWQAEMDRMKAEMARMQAVQRQVVYEMGAAPPPLYNDPRAV